MEGTSSTPASPQPDHGGLQLDKAEFPEDARPTSCAGCGQEIAATYFEVNARVACPACREKLLAAAKGGSGARRFVRALGWGGGGAVVGAALWMAITLWTGWEIGLVAIVVGWMVGCGVRKGADGRGGWAYQGLAVALSYLAIVATYVPALHESILEGAREFAPPGSTAMDEGQAPEVALGAQAPQEASVLVLPLYGLFLLGVACFVPFLALPENLIGLLIIGFALFEAWKLNKRVPLVVSGPFEVVRPERQAAAA